MSALHFYQNRQMELFAAKETKRLTLRQLIFFGRSMNEERLVKSANYVRSELTVRIAHRLRDMQALPYIVVTQDEVAKVYDLYWTAFDKFRSFPPITTMAENIKFCTFVRGLLNEHASVIPALSLGFTFSSPYMPSDQLDSFMSRMLVSRISRRVLAEHHIALTEDFIKGSTKGRPGRGALTRNASTHVGIIQTELSPKASIERCVDLLRKYPSSVIYRDPENPDSKNVPCPRVVVDGHVDTTFAYIREQFEYIIFELLKNALYATSYRHRNETTPPEIRATISTGSEEVQVRISDQGGGLLEPDISSPSDLFSFSATRNMMRMEDDRIEALRKTILSPHGMRATVDEQLERWHERDPENVASTGPLPRLGIGLPMSNIFATYFGGSLRLVSLDGWGTDVHLKLPKLGTKLEGVEV
ncbi:alpha-ketoacid dehydrogenase kinase [Schizopora paradoxa]|uniref:Protein-serine/threonine kinase n=1 Tax=Schizopora paradoxa TaxID=27342 RepID=A0A0H2SDD8_9AGAM|nr:alpha-ketoacid dehydrogenase kinase [Schizopora paradoxa]